MKAGTLILLALTVKSCLIPFTTLSYAQDSLYAPGQSTAGISGLDLYSQYSTMVYEGFVRSQGLDKYPLDGTLYHHLYGPEYLNFTNLVQMSAYDHSRDSGSDAYPVPEPATLLLFGMGLIFLAESGRRLKKPGTGL